MSGRIYSGRGCAGRGSGISSAYSSKNTTTEYKKQIMEFTPHTAVKHQSVTYDMIKEHILQEIQKDLKNGSDMAMNLRKGIDCGIPVRKPIRLRAVLAKSKTNGKPIKEELGESKTNPDDLEDMKMDQESYNMEYTMDLKEYKIRNNT